MNTTDTIPRETVPVLHVNLLTGSMKQRIFCRKKHAMERVEDLPCAECGYFRGTGQGDTIQCEWEDFPRLSGDRTRVIAPARQTNEYRAISGYIDKGMLKKG